MSKRAKDSIQSVFDAVGKLGQSDGLGGRPKLSISPTVIYRLSMLGLTTTEMANFLGVSLSTVNRRLREPEFRHAYSRGKSNVKISLRRSQFKLAMAGNTRMLIWLGKCYLGQKDNPIVHAADHDLPEQEEGRVIHVPWTPELEAELKAIDAEFPELDGIA